jgi:hypothetical protein
VRRLHLRPIFHHRISYLVSLSSIVVTHGSIYTGFAHKVSDTSLTTTTCLPFSFHQVHSGGAESGHYTAIGKRSEGPGQQWYYGITFGEGPKTTGLSRKIGISSPPLPGTFSTTAALPKAAGKKSQSCPNFLARTIVPMWYSIGAVTLHSPRIRSFPTSIIYIVGQKRRNI